jgi:hypothetical protein
LTQKDEDGEQRTMVERRENKQTSSSYELYFEARRRSFAFVMEIHLSSKGIYLRPWAKAPTLATTGGFDSETPGAERESAAGSRAVASEAGFPSAWGNFISLLDQGSQPHFTNSVKRWLLNIEASQGSL